MRSTVVLLFCIVIAGCGGPTVELGATAGQNVESPTGTGHPMTTDIPTDSLTPFDHAGSVTERDYTTVRILDTNGTVLGIVNASVASEPDERYRGLSDAASLPDGSGMLFVYSSEDHRSFVMRDMAFPLDILFIAGNRTITSIHQAPVENESPLTQYTGSARWVLEVPYNWTTNQEIDVGDVVAIPPAGNRTYAD